MSVAIPSRTPFVGTSQPSSSSLIGSGSMSLPSQSSADEQASQAQLHATLARMALYVRKTRLQINPFFSDFDRHKQGAISWAQFARVLATVGFSALTHELVENLSRHYSLQNDPTKVSYKSFIRDIEEIAAAQQSASHDAMQRSQAGPTLDFQEKQASLPSMTLKEMTTTSSGGYTAGQHKQPFQTLHDIHSETPLTTSKILHKIQTICQQRRIILNDIFQDYDSLRKNLITLQRFRRCLDVAGFSLSNAEANVLVAPYLSQDGEHIEYKRFIADIEAPFIPANSEQDPLTELPKFQPYRLEENETPQPKFTLDELDRIEFLLKELGYETHTRRILIKPGFQHHDHTRSGCVTSRQFSSILTSTFPYRFAENDLELLSAKYRRSDVGICYTAFLKDIELHEVNAAEYAKTLHPSHAATYLNGSSSASGSSSSSSMQPLPKPSGSQVIAGMRIIPTKTELDANEAHALETTSLNDVLTRIKTILLRQRMSLDDVLFADFDHLNKGRVTRPQFFRCLTSQGLKLSPTDVHVLTINYPHSEVREEVDYRKFTQDLSQS